MRQIKQAQAEFEEIPIPMTKEDRSLAQCIKDAINTYEAVIFICPNCGRLCFMVDPGDGLITHLEEQEIQ